MMAPEAEEITFIIGVCSPRAVTATRAFARAKSLQWRRPNPLLDRIASKRHAAPMQNRGDDLDSSS